MNNRPFYETYPMNVPIVIENVLTEEECKTILNLFETHQEAITKGLVKSEGRLKPDVRDVDIINLLDLFGELDHDSGHGKTVKHVIEIIHKAVYENNLELFNFDITDIEQMEVGRYGVGGFYNKHADSNQLEPARMRKLSFSINLNDDFVGGNLLFPGFKEDAEYIKKVGSMTLFPTYLSHEVQKVENGTRYSIFGWAMGPRFK